MALAGFMGSGKSTVGRAVAQRLGRRFVDLDQVLVDVSGRPIADLFRDTGEAAFRAAEAAALPAALEVDVVVALGGGTPFDDGSWKLLKRRALTLWLDAPLEVIWPRVAGDMHRPMLQNRSREELGRLLAEREKRYRQCDVRIDASQDLQKVVEDAVRACAG